MRFKKTLKPLLWTTLIFISVLALLDKAYPLALPSAQDQHFAQLVVDRQGQPLRAFADSNGVWRQAIRLEQVSEDYLQALLNYEDRWFWYHPGINPMALLRAAWLNRRCGCIVSGGSTLTMQVARRFHPHSRTVAGKLQQILRALQLEWHLSKTDILELYLNYAPFGGTVEGVQAASFAYLDKSASELTQAEAALLAVLPQAPSRMRPDRYPERAQQARDKVLDRLLAFGVWDANSVASAKQEQVIAQRPQRPNVAPLLSRYLRQQYPQQQTIHSSIDFNLQRGLEDDLNSWIVNQPKHSSAAILVLDNRSHKVRAYLGSADFKDSARFAHVDMVRAIRSPGSTLKPFIYAMAIEQGLIHSHSLLSDAPRHYGDYRPENFSRGFSGPVTVTEALQRSLNVPAVQVLEQLGSQPFYARLQSAHIDMQLPAGAKPNLSMALGGVGVSLWDLVKAYSALAQQGQVISPSLLEAEDKPAPRYLLSPAAAWITFHMLANNPRSDRVRSEHLAQHSNVLAWKTGTSYGYRDAWAVGVSKDYTVGVWLGRPDGTPQPGHFGALNAAPLLFRISDVLNQHSAPLAQPDSVSAADICWPLGGLKRDTPSAHCHQSHRAWISEKIVPPTFSDPQSESWTSNPLTLWLSQDSQQLASQFCTGINVQPHKIALWPQALEPWLPKQHTRRGQIPAPDQRCDVPTSLALNDLQILGIDNGNIYQSPRQGGAMPSISLQALGGRGVRDWFVNGRYIFSTGEQQALPYQFTQLGEQQIVVIDEQGNADRLRVRVEEGL